MSQGHLFSLSEVLDFYLFPIKVFPVMNSQILLKSPALPLIMCSHPWYL